MPFDILHLTDVLHHLHQQSSVLLFLALIVGIGVGEHVLRVSLQADVGPHIEVLQVLEGSLELMGEEICVDFNPAVDLHFERLDEVPEVNLDPSLLDWSLDLGDLYLDLLEVGDFLIEEIEVGDQLSATLEEDVLPLHLLLPFDLLDLWLVLF